jgi:protein ImuA
MSIAPASVLATPAFIPSGLDTVLKHPGVWRRSASAQHHVRALPTGLAELDALLPGGGWPCGALSEILFEHDGLGELALLMPALAELTRRRQRVIFVVPPYIPYAPALSAHGLDLRYVVQIQATAVEGAWSAEQCLRSGSCGAVLSWLPEADYTQLRRLQLAAESGDALAFLFRPSRAATKQSPAALRLQLHANAEQVEIEILKCRGNLDQRSTRLRWRA